MNGQWATGPLGFKTRFFLAPTQGWATAFTDLDALPSASQPHKGYCFLTGTNGSPKPGINREFGEPRTSTARSTTTHVDGSVNGQPNANIPPGPAQRALAACSNRVPFSSLDSIDRATNRGVPSPDG